MINHLGKRAHNRTNSLCALCVHSVS